MIIESILFIGSFLENENSWEKITQISLGIVGTLTGLITAIILINRARMEIRPVLIITETKETDKLYKIIIIKNIGNRVAKDIKIHTRKTFNDVALNRLEPEQEKEIQVPSLNYSKVTYKRSYFSLTRFKYDVEDKDFRKKLKLKRKDLINKTRRRFSDNSIQGVIKKHIKNFDEKSKYRVSLTTNDLSDFNCNVELDIREEKIDFKDDVCKKVVLNDNINIVDSVNFIIKTLNKKINSVSFQNRRTVFQWHLSYEELETLSKVKKSNKKANNENEFIDFDFTNNLSKTQRVLLKEIDGPRVKLIKDKDLIIRVNEDPRNNISISLKDYEIYSNSKGLLISKLPLRLRNFCKKYLKEDEISKIDFFYSLEILEDDNGVLRFYDGRENLFIKLNEEDSKMLLDAVESYKNINVNLSLRKRLYNAFMKK